MGGGGSKSSSGPTKAAPIVVEEQPPIPGLVSFGLGDAQGCEWPGKRGVECRLTVAAGLSSSGAKLYREQGTVTAEQCALFQKDAEMVQQGKLAFEEMKTKARAGKYFIPTGNGYCAQYPPKSEEEMRKTTAPIWGERGGLWSNFSTPIAIRKMTTEGGYSSITKLFIKPSIPFKVTFNGETFTIPLMTLFHPSPVRLENVQHDAMLTLGDPSEGNRAKGSGATDAVILVPLVGSLNAGPSGEFISKIARYMTAVLQPDPVTGQYKTIDIPTGNDWDLSKLFPGTPSNGETLVATGYFAWSASGGVVKSSTPVITANPFPQADIWKYPYIPSGKSNVRYIMLKDPVPVNVFDLQTVRMLPSTPAEQAIDTFVPSTLSFVTPKTCSTTPSAAGRESMTNPEQCDPFAGVQGNAFTKDTLVQVIIGALTTFGVLLAIYFAVKLFANTDWGFKLPRWGHLFGNFAVNIPLEEREKIPVTKLFTPTREQKDIPFPKDMHSAAESRLSAPLEGAPERPLPPTTKKRAAKDAALIEATGAEAEAEAKAKAEEEARLIEKAGVEAEAAAKAKAEEEARLIEAARVEAEAAAKARAEEEARLIEAARIEAEADAERIRRETQEPAPLPTEEEARRLREIGPAGTGLFSGEELEAAKKDREATLKKAREFTKRRVDLSKKAEARQAAAEDEARKADEAEAKARERAAIEARDMAETAPSIARRRVRGTFANTTKAPPPIIAEALKAKEAATKAAKEAEDKAAKEAEEAQASVNAAKEAEAKAAKEAEEAKAVQDKYMKMTLDAFKKQAEDKAVEEEIQRKAEEAAKSASKAAERQADLLKRAEAERKKQAEEYEAKQKEKAASEFRPTSGRSSAAVPKATGLKPPEGRPPPTETEIQDVLSTFAEDTKLATTPAAKSLARVEKKQLTDEQRSDVISRLEDIRDGLMSHMEDARRNTQLTAGLWPNWSAWMRMEQEKKRHKMFVAPAVKKLLAFKDAIESSGLDALRRPPYDTAYANLLKMVVKLVNDSQTRIQNITTDAKPSKIVFGGRRRKMKRKSTRRYVA